MLRLRPLGEADRIVHLFSRERGKLHAVAKGVRKPRSKFGARLDFFSRSTLTIYPGRSLHIVTGAKTVSRAWNELVDPDVFAFLAYVAEVVDALSEPDLPVPELYELLCQIHDAVSRSAPTELLMPAFDLGALAALGWAPELDACARCGSPLGRRPLAGGRARLSPEAGGLICSRCYERERADHGGAEIVSLTSSELDALRRLRGMDPMSIMAADALLAHDRVLKSITRATHAFIEHHLGRRSRALKAAPDRPARSKAAARA